MLNQQLDSKCRPVQGTLFIEDPIQFFEYHNHDKGMCTTAGLNHKCTFWQSSFSGSILLHFIACDCILGTLVSFLHLGPNLKIHCERLTTAN